MRVLRRRRPSPAFIIGVLALVVACAGSATAATVITSKQIKNGTIQLADLNKRTILELRGRGPEGPAGPQGPQGVQSAAGLAGAQYGWDAWIYPNPGRPQSDGHVATFRFSAPGPGFVLVTAHFGVRVHNNNDGTTDCRVQSQIATSPGVPNGSAGYIDEFINGNLLTQFDSGTYLEFNESVSRVLPVAAGSNTFFLNGQYNCADVLWGPIDMNAVFLDQNPAATLSVP
jgi:hypothetical protein